MKKLFVAAALLMATTAAHAGNSVSFEIEGHRIHVEAPKNCNSLSCIQISGPGISGSAINLKGFKGFNNSDDDDVADNNPPPVTKTVPAPAPVAQAPVAQPVAPVASSAPPAPTTVASTAPVAAAPAVNNVAPVAAAPAPVAVAPQAPVAAAPAADPNSPLGIWATEENKGNVRIEQCGANLCGYAVNTGEKILISMKPSGAKWTGQIHDPDSGRNYDSTIAMKGTDALRVQGCAFGGMFCGGQTWKRVS
jgi:uncharacterized protein (DUF2147 family)